MYLIGNKYVIHFILNLYKNTNKYLKIVYNFDFEFKISKNFFCNKNFINNLSPEFWYETHCHCHIHSDVWIMSVQICFAVLDTKWGLHKVLWYITFDIRSNFAKIMQIINSLPFYSGTLFVSFLCFCFD